MSDVLGAGSCPRGDVVDAVVSSVVLVADPRLQEAAVDYWDMSSAAHRGVVDRLRRVGSVELALATEAVLADPHDPVAVHHLSDVVAATFGDDGAWRSLGEQALHADGTGRLAAHVGRAHDPAAVEVGAADLLAWPAPAPPADVPDAPVLVVVPFRDRTAGRSRLRNLLACVRALADQTADRASYRVVVVEADEQPRWEAVVRPRVHSYLHLRAPGHFNKAWAVNAGVVQAGPSEVVCVLDADVLVDREFVDRNVARFRARGAQAHLPFRDALCLDPASSDAAIRRRLLHADASVAPDVLRGAVLRRPPGHCVWVRTDLFHRVGGFDERFVGWGGEDLDLVFRLDVVGAVDRYGDALLHLHHERPQTQVDGKRFYAGRRLLSWHPAGPIGQLDAPATSTDDDLAGLIERVEDAAASL